MEPNPLHWLPGSFFRKPEWRWLRAAHLITTGRRLDPRIDDDGVARARAALRGRGGGPTVAPVRAAQGIYASDPAVKGELEARLLTDEPLARIAKRAALPITVVEAYEATFFSVRGMRQATDWLLTRAIGYSPFRGFTAPMPFAAWKLAAFAGGPLLLDVVIAATTGQSLPKGVFQGAVRSLAQLWVATMGATTDDDFARAVRDRQRLRALNARRSERRVRVSPQVTAMKAFLLGLPLTQKGSRTRVARSEEGCEREVDAFLTDAHLADTITSPDRLDANDRGHNPGRGGKNETEIARPLAASSPEPATRVPRVRRWAG